MPWWEPFEEIERMGKKMERIFHKLGEPLEGIASFPVDMEETGDKIIVKADLPGFSKEEVSIKATDATLDISAQHKEKKVEKTRNMLKTERKFGAMRRTFTLPAAINPDSIEAELKNGMLVLKAEKKEKKKVAKEIKVK